MRLDALLPRLDGARILGDAAVEVTGASHDSRTVRPGDLFAALPGERHHGLEFLAQALDRGAAAVLTDREPGDRPPVPWIVSPAPRRHAALAAFGIAGDPQDRLDLAAVTGTNGKSTVVTLLARCLEAAGAPCGVFGTVAYRLPGRELSAVRTTPEATDLAPMLAELAAAGGRAAAMEVSSHALALDRVAGLRFRAAVFTNLTRDHLDYHGTIEAYFRAKRRLFDEHLAAGGHRVLCVDDPWGARLAAEAWTGDLTYGLEGGAVTAGEVRHSLEGTAFRLVLPGASLRVATRLVGPHNLQNTLGAAAAAMAMGVPPEAIAEGLEGAPPLPGRLEAVPAALPFTVFVDYAHTPAGLRAVLEALRTAGAPRIVAVFGAGGDRDPGKRAPMGTAVGELADVAIVTSDNPRSEDPAAIAEAVAAGVRSAGSEPVVVLDRRAAIARALETARPGDVVLVAGKGHEREQILADRTVPFSDRDVVLELAGEATCA